MMAEGGESPLQRLETWNAQISTALGAFVSLSGLVILFAAGSSCKLAGLFQLIAGLVVIAIEGPNFLPQLAMAAPAGMFFEGKPPWLKVVVYALLAIFPAFDGCFKAFFLGFVAASLITAVHAILLFARRTPPDEMRFQGGPGSGQPQGDPAYSPTSP